MQLETSGSAFPPYYVSCVGITQMKQWKPNCSTFQAPKEEHFGQQLHYAHLWQSFLSQLDSGDTTGIYISWNAAAAELSELSFYLLVVLFILCFWDSCWQFHHPSPHTSFPLCKGLTRKLLLATHLSQICWIFTGRFFSTGQTKWLQHLQLLHPVWRRCQKNEEIDCFEELTQHNKTCLWSKKYQKDAY